MSYSDSLRVGGRVISVLGWIGVAYFIVTWYVMPLIESPKAFLLSIVPIEAITSALMVFIPLGVVIWAGHSISRLAIERRFRKENQIIGLVKAYGRISLDELAARMNMSAPETERTLASLRVKRDVIFSIQDGYVVMPGSERTRPLKEIEKITREIVTTQCAYCGSLVPVTSKKCPECGAQLKPAQI